jgi:hypothetical protein
VEVVEVRPYALPLYDTTDCAVDCACYSDASSFAGDNGQDDDIVSKREYVADPELSLGPAFDAVIGERSLYDNGTHSLLGRPVILDTAVSRVCKDTVSIKIPAYASTKIIGYYESVVRLLFCVAEDLTGLLVATTIQADSTLPLAPTYRSRWI